MIGIGVIAMTWDTVATDKSVIAHAHFIELRKMEGEKERDVGDVEDVVDVVDLVDVRQLKNRTFDGNDDGFIETGGSYDFWEDARTRTC